MLNDSSTEDDTDQEIEESDKEDGYFMSSFQL